ncbi:hypothetical protein BDV93DRAFT_563894 [Ceratobasidium sp. AG-I]|nr:hypothetical protein BDV93DRAFT_563894 [Ceratobasidium sp. AG-I]
MDGDKKDRVRDADLNEANKDSEKPKVPVTTTKPLPSKPAKPLPSLIASSKPPGPTKSLTPTLKTIMLPGKPKASKLGIVKSNPKLSSNANAKPSSAGSKPLSTCAGSKPSSSSSLPSSRSKGRPSSRASSINGSSLVRVSPITPEVGWMPPTPMSPRSALPKVMEEKAGKEKKDLAEKKAVSPMPVRSPQAAQIALPASSPPHPTSPAPPPPTPPAPSPPMPSVPTLEAVDDDIDAARWATEMFSLEYLAKRTEGGQAQSEAGDKAASHLAPFTSAEPVSLDSSQPTSLVHAKEIKLPPHPHTPTYGVLATGSIAQGSLVLEYRCALSDAQVPSQAG